MITRIPGTNEDAWIDPARRNLVRAAKDTQRFYAFRAGLLPVAIVGVIATLTLLVVDARIEEAKIDGASLVVAIPTIICWGAFFLHLALFVDAKKQFKAALDAGDALRVNSHTYRTLASLLYLTCNEDIMVLVRASAHGDMYAQVIMPYAYNCIPLEEKRSKTEKEAEISDICKKFLTQATTAVAEVVKRSEQTRTNTLATLRPTTDLLGHLQRSARPQE